MVKKMCKQCGKLCCPPPPPPPIPQLNRNDYSSCWWWWSLLLFALMLLLLVVVIFHASKMYSNWCCFCVWWWYVWHWERWRMSAACLFYQFSFLFFFCVNILLYLFLWDFISRRVQKFAYKSALLCGSTVLTEARNRQAQRTTQLVYNLALAEVLSGCLKERGMEKGGGRLPTLQSRERSLFML